MYNKKEIKILNIEICKNMYKCSSPHKQNNTFLSQSVVLVI